MTGAGTLAVILLIAAAAVLAYLIGALLYPDKF
ncbi:MAG: potassium-transporting ATPase subunit F [Gordonia sp. (in: high G+C Gram-positive bacteria)]